MEYGKLKQNFIYNILYQASVYIAPLVTTPYLGRVLGADRIGRYSFAQSIVAYFVLLATLGTTYYGQRKIAAARGDVAERTRVFLEIALLRVFNTLIAAAIYLIFIVPRSANPRLYLIAGLEILSVGLDISWFFQGIERFGVIALTNCASKALSILLIFLCVRHSGQLNLYVTFYCGAILFGFLCQWTFLGRHLSRGVKPDLRSEKLHVKIALGLFVAQVAMQVYTVLDKTMIGLITHSNLQNGYYEQAQKLIRILIGCSTAVGTVMVSRVASLYSEGRNGDIRELISFSFRIVCAISIPIFCVIQLCADRFVPWFYGADFAPVEPLLRVLSILPFVIGCSSVVGLQFFVPTGRERWLTLSVTAGCLVNFALNLMLIARLRSTGAAIASVIAECSVTGIQFWLARGKLDIRRVPAIALRYLILCLPMLAAGFSVKLLTAGMGWSAPFVIAGCVAVYAAELFAVRDPLVGFILKNTGEPQ